MNGIMYILSTGCQWRAIPKDLPPRSTLFDYLDLWSYDGTIDRIHHTLYVACREQGERAASPTAAIIDSQSVKSAEKGGRASIRMAMTRAKKSRERSAKFSPPIIWLALAAQLEVLEGLTPRPWRPAVNTASLQRAKPRYN